MTPMDRACEIEEIAESLRYLETRLNISPLLPELWTSASALASALRCMLRDLSRLRNDDVLNDLIIKHGGKPFLIVDNNRAAP